MKKNFLITSAGTGSGFSTAEAIATNFREWVTLHIGDINPPQVISASIHADHYFQMPRIDDLNYKKTTIRYIEDHKIDFVIPFIDLDILEMAGWYNRRELPHGVYLQVSSADIARICSDKYTSFNWLKNNNINTPETYLFSNHKKFDQLLLKPRHGFGSTVKIIRECDHLSIDEPEKYILQEVCHSPEVTIDVFNDIESGSFFFICRERIEIKAGVCTKARLFYDEYLGEMAFKIAQGLGLSFFCFQVMKYKDKWAVTDINPRLGAGTAMSTAVGMDFYSAMIAQNLGMDYSKYIYQQKEEHFVTRQYRNILTK